MRTLAKYLLTTGLLLLVPYWILPQTPTVPSTVSPQPTYDDSGGGLKHQLEDAMKVAKNHDRTNLVSLTTSMVLPDPHLWFTKVFGPQIGAAYEMEYTLSIHKLPIILADALEGLATQKFTNLEAVRFTKACDDKANEIEYPVLASRETQEPLSAVNFGNGSSSYTLKFFAYVGGAFRFIGDLKPYPSPNLNVAATGTKPLKTSDSAQAAHILKQVPPIYPDEARREHL